MPVRDIDLCGHQLRLSVGPVGGPGAPRCSVLLWGRRISVAFRDQLMTPKEESADEDVLFRI